MTKQLYHLRDLNDPLTRVIKDDPVRPHIPLSQRVNAAAEIMLLRAGDDILAVTCMQWLRDIPESEQDLIDYPKDQAVAVFYTIWSYAPGAGAELIEMAADWLKAEYANLKSIVTLSPQTELARRFHTRNGAETYRQNATSVNYCYYNRPQQAQDA